MQERLKTDRDLLRRQCDRVIRDRDDMRVMRDRAKIDQDEMRRQLEKTEAELEIVQKDLDFVHTNLMTRKATCTNRRDRDNAMLEIRPKASICQINVSRDTFMKTTSGHSSSTVVRPTSPIVSSIKSDLHEIRPGCATVKPHRGAHEEQEHEQEQPNKLQSNSLRGTTTLSSGCVGSNGCVFHTTGLYHPRR